MLGVVVGVRLLTELLDPARYGELALGMTAAALVNQSIMGPLGGGITRFFAPAVERKDVAGYLESVRTLAWWATLLILAIMLAAIMYLVITGRYGWIPVIVAALVFAILTGYNSILSGIQNAARQRSVVAMHQAMESWARYLVAALLIIWLGATSWVALVGYAIAVALVLLSQFRLLRKIERSVPAIATGDDHWRDSIARYSWPIATWGVLTWVQTSSDRWALEIFASTQQVGLYAVVFQLGYYPMSLATGMALQLASPIIFQRAGDATDSARNSSVRRLVVLLALSVLAMTALACIIATLFHPLIFRILVAKEYSQVSYLLPLALLSSGIFAAGQTVALNLMSQMKTRAMMVVKITTAVLGIALNFAAASRYGIEGMVAASVVFSIAYSLWIAAIALRAPKPAVT